MTEFISLLIAGVVTGSVYAVSASGLVITYNTTGIFNFAQGALGLVLAYVFWQCWQGWGWNPILALVFVLLVVAPALGILLERLIMRPLYGATTTVSIVVTLGLLLLLFGVAVTVWSPTNTYTVPEFFSGHQISLGSVNVSIEQLITIGVAVLVAVFFRLFFKLSRTGIAMRAVVDDPRLARMTGAPSGRISGYAWMIGVMLAGVSGILLAPTTMDATVLAELVIYGYAAAVVGRLRSLPLTFLGAMLLGIVSSLAVGYVPESQLTNVTAALPMVLLFAVLLFMPEARLAIGRVVRMRPPKAASLRSTLMGAAILIVIGVVGAEVLSGSNLSTLGSSFAIGLLALSLVPLSGYGGQVSLCQFTFAGIGALTMHWVAGGNSILGLLAAVGVTGAAGAVLTLPALRLRGIYLALATLSFAVLMDNVFFNAPSIVGAGGIVSVGRAGLFGFHFGSDRVYVVFLGVVFALFLVAVGSLRRGGFGRRLVAMQDSPVASATLGGNLVVTKLIVFSGSAALAGLAGALLAGLSGSASAQQFTFLQSIVLFVAVTLAGSRMLTSAVFAGVALAVAPVIGQHIPQLTDFTYLLIGVGIIAIGRNPNALGALYTRASDWRTSRTGGSALEAESAPAHRESLVPGEEVSVV